MPLESAHQGYRFQDIAVAYFLIKAILDHYDQIIVDKKLVTEDKFDDLTTINHSVLSRYQFKAHKVGTTRFMVVDDFKSGILRLDDLVRTHKSLEQKGKYHVCVTWQAPQDDLLKLLIPTEEGSFSSINTKTYKFSLELLWEAGKEPIWSELKNNDFTREDLESFLDNFIIECEIPQASLNEAEPGTLEQLLISTLEEKIGVGRYPNILIPSLIAERLIAIATLARSKGRTFTPQDVVHELGLRTDFGKVDQQSPVVESKFVYRNLFQTNLQELKEKQVIVLTGQPGAGKSWALSKVAEDLRDEDTITAIHYCYLNPGDKDIQKRITSNALFGNLVSEILVEAPYLEEAKESRYTADLKELELLLKAATKASKRICLIVDGIDHISRVFAESRNLSLGEIDIVEKLSEINLPENCYLIIGSQPGVHLDPLLSRQDSIVLEVPKWEKNDIENLVAQYKITDKLGAQKEQIYLELTKKSEGNPLYATFLIRALETHLQHNSDLSISDFLKQNPNINGEIANYYEYLYKTLTEKGVDPAIAETLGLIDFSVTPEDLKIIFPANAHRVDETLEIMSPILLTITGYGGTKIYHESFRRFILKKLKENEAQIDKILAPVIEWLNTKDFYFDSKAYRFLPVLLYRANRNNEVIELYVPSFVILSLEAGRSRSEIEESIQLAIEVAVEELNWPFLIRLAELTRAIHTCFEEKLLDLIQFNEVFGALYGYEILTERLIFDGITTFSPEIGLRLCSLCDDKGVTPPWAEYLKELQKPNNESVSLARIHGLLRLKGFTKVFKNVEEWLSELDFLPSRDYLQALLDRLFQFGGFFVYEKLLRKRKLFGDLKELIRFLYMEKLLEENNLVKAKRVAKSLNIENLSLEDKYYCVSHDLIDIDQITIPDLNSFDISLGQGSYSAHKETVGPWILAVKLASYTNPEILINEIVRVTGEGWYRRWLIFIIQLSEIQRDYKSNPHQVQQSIIESIEKLAEDLRPFVGSPRACDLYDIEPLIHQSFRELLELILDDETWTHVLNSLGEISYRLTTFLQGSPGGPLISQAFIDLLLPYVGNTRVSTVILEKIRSQAKASETSGEFYEIQASHEITLTSALIKSSLFTEAKEHWKLAVQFYCSYGYRKDITIYELLGGLTAISSVSREEAEKLLLKVQPLVNNTVIHTDGKSTNHAPIDWFSILCKTSSPRALKLLAQSLVDEAGGHISWSLEACLKNALSTLKDTIPLPIWFALTYTLPFTDDLEERTADLLEQILKVQMTKGKELAEKLFQSSLPYILEDCPKPDPKTLAMLNDFVSKNNYYISSPLPIVTEQKQEDTILPLKEKESIFNNFTFSFNDTPHAILTKLADYGSSIRIDDDFINRLGYKLVELIQSGDERFVYGLLKGVYQRIYYKDGKIDSFLDLVEGLHRYGLDNIVVYVLSLMDKAKNSKDNWSLDGTKKEFSEISKAISISKEFAFKSIISDLAEYVRGGGYIYGITSYLIDLFAYLKELDKAVSIWEAAYEVISLRLASPQENYGVLNPLSDIENIDITSASLELLLSRIGHPELRRKKAALSGLSDLMDEYPTEMATAFKAMCKTNSATTSIVLVMLLTLQLDQVPLAFLKGIYAELDAMTRCDRFDLKFLSQNLLQTISPSPHSQTIPIFGFPEKSKREQEIKKYWDEFPYIVTKKMGEVAKNKVFRRRMKNQMEAVYDRGYKLDPVPILSWADEYHELALNETAMQFKPILWREARQFPDIDNWLAKILLPNIKLDIAFEKSRTVRPSDLSKPSEISNCLLNVTPLINPQGWIRLASYEEEYIFDTKHYRQVKSKRTASSGVIGQGNFNFDYLPFRIGDYRDWFEAYTPNGGIDLSRITNPLIGFDIISDYISSIPLLMLDKELISRLNLELPDFPGRLALFDNSGMPVVIFRRWWTNSFGDRFSEEIPKLFGCDLIASPELYGRIQALSEEELKTVFTVNERDF